MIIELKTTADERKTWKALSHSHEGTYRLVEDVEALLSERVRIRREAMEECEMLCKQSFTAISAANAIRELAAKECK